MHPVGLHEVLIFLVNAKGVPCELPDVLIKIAAKVLVEDREEQVELLVYPLLWRRKKQC